MKNKDDRLIYLVFRVEHELINYLDKRLKDAGIQITTKQSGLLFLLREKNNQSMSELSKGLAVDKSAITGAIDRLEKENFVTRVLNTNDRREYLIAITSRGLNELATAEKIIKETNEKIKQGFSSQEIEIFKKIMNSIFKKIKKT